MWSVYVCVCLAFLLHPPQVSTCIFFSEKSFFFLGEIILLYLHFFCRCQESHKKWCAVLPEFLPTFVIFSSNTRLEFCVELLFFFPRMHLHLTASNVVFCYYHVWNGIICCFIDILDSLTCWNAFCTFLFLRRLLNSIYRRRVLSFVISNQEGTHSDLIVSKYCNVLWLRASVERMPVHH